MRITIEIDPSGAATVQPVAGAGGRSQEQTPAEPVNAGAVPEELLQLAEQKPMGPGSSPDRAGPLLMTQEAMQWPFGLAPTQAIGFVEGPSAGPAPLMPTE